MGARTLNARLTGRFLAVATLVVGALAIAAVALTSYTLDESDSTLAKYRAEALEASLVTELAEGDGIAIAANEILDAAHLERIRLAIVIEGVPLRSTETTPFEDGLGRVPAGSCTTLADERGERWRACSTPSQSPHGMVAAVSIEGHRMAVATLAKSLTASVLLALTVMVVLVRRALQEPVGDVTALVEWSSEVRAGVLALRAPRSDTVEIRELRDAFQSLVDALREALERERATNGHIAHELRTPLAALLADAALADRSRADVLRLSEVVEAIIALSDTTTERCRALVNVADVVRAMAPSETAVEAPDEALTPGDERLLALAVQNLVANARKHGGGSPVSMRVSREADALRVSVVDAGPGASPDQRAKMFDRYYRGVPDGTGQGLGLALVRAVAARHGGVAEARAASPVGLDVSFTVSGVARWAD